MAMARAALLNPGNNQSTTGPAATSKTSKIEEAVRLLMERGDIRKELRQVVVQFTSVGSIFAQEVLRSRGDLDEPCFDWDGVRQCVRHLKGSGLKVVGVAS